VTAASLSPRARRELFEAAAWIADDNPMAAEGLIDAVEASAELIGNHPRVGVLRPHLLPPPFRFRTLTGYPYLIVYNSERVPPEIVAIIHGARNLPPLLRDLE
jgi:toxin ParE1/3/4